MITANGRLFEYAPKLTAFEFGDLHSPNVLIFIGGLGDGLLTVPYVPLLAEKLATIGWSVVQIQFTSSFIGFGTGSLARDADEISKLVAYLRSPLSPVGSRKKVGLMGHSTGSQNTLYYLSKFAKTAETDIDFGVLQASASDREAIVSLAGEEVTDKSVAYAQDLISKGSGREFMPVEITDQFFGAPINANRWFALASIRGDDDFFSTYLGPEDLKQTFGKVERPLLVLYSGADEYVSPDTDKHALVKKFQAATDPKFWSPLSTVVEGGSHNLGPTSKNPDAPAFAVGQVVKFLDGI
ncbi:hypothetical protein OGAPHI_003734 [Ogataea philodendri]|uniref:DUF1749-domain-containing protein n=1 Tax=Ogataea philodendri TaxID=1378263 RepID=A0A9P8P4W5_9ASCO|nr:uncharacterized protein OGAPHI_003734 [Ogataea philodendri]KAH3665548.1 hypothetical protein OGAPHI_003734 [Ogataea philodendri]